MKPQKSPPSLVRLGHILLGAFLLHLIWALLAVVLHQPLLPAPWAVYAHTTEAWTGGMAQHLVASLLRIVVGLSLALFVALLVALLMHRYRFVGSIVGAFIYFSYPIPKLALLPVVMLLAGLGEVTKIVMILLIILFQLVVSLRDALGAIPKDNYVVMHTLGAGPLSILRHVLLPALLPDLLSALRVAIGTAVSVLFVTETYGTSQGMGYYIVHAWMRFNYLDMYAGIVFLGVMGFLLFVLTDVLEYLLVPWKRPI